MRCISRSTLSDKPHKDKRQGPTGLCAATYAANAAPLPRSLRSPPRRGKGKKARPAPALRSLSGNCLYALRRDKGIACIMACLWAQKGKDRKASPTKKEKAIFPRSRPASHMARLAPCLASARFFEARAYFLPCRKRKRLKIEIWGNPLFAPALTQFRK